MIFKKRLLAISLMAGFLYTGCSSFMKDEEVDRVKLKYQAGNYLLLQDVVRNDATLAKGTVVKLKVVRSKEWIKFYAYDTKEQLLSSNRFILLFMFEDDFTGKKYNQESVDKELAKLVKPLDSDELSKLESKKTEKKVKK